MLTSGNLKIQILLKWIADVLNMKGTKPSNIVYPSLYRPSPEEAQLWSEAFDELLTNKCKSVLKEDRASFYLQDYHLPVVFRKGCHK